MIFAISGHAGSGKDTFADVVIQHWSRERGSTHKSFYRLAFADPIRRAACELLYRDMELFTHRASKDAPISVTSSTTPRDVLKALGNWTRNNISKDVFADIMCSKIKDIYEKDADAVIMITDLRMPQEISKLHVEFGDDLVLVCIDADQRTGFDMSTAHDTERHVVAIHQSPLIKKRVLIYNNSDYNTYSDRIIKTMTQFFGPI